MPVCKVASSSFVAFFDKAVLASGNEIVSTPQRIITTQRRQEIHKIYSLGGKSQEFLNNFSKNKDTYFKFAFVRHPLSRLVSAYFEFKKRMRQSMNERYGLSWKNIYNVVTDNGKHEVSFERFVDFIVNKEYNLTDHINAHWVNQHHTLYMHGAPKIKQVFNNDEIYDFIGHLETFDKDVQTVLSKIKIKCKKFPWLLRSPAYNYEDFYNDEILNMAYEYYEKDFDLLGYGKQ